MEKMKLRVKVIFDEEVLGMSSADPEIHKTYIASKAPDAKSTAEEVEALGIDTVAEQQMTIFPRNENGEPIMWDYQIKGFFKDTTGMLRKVKNTKASSIKAYKKEIDGLLFPQPRATIIHLPEGESIGTCERPLRASTPQGERVALASSETVPAGSWMEFDIMCLTKDMYELAVECLDYGELRGMGQWRNSGKGRFHWELIDDETPKKSGRKKTATETAE